MKQSLQALLFLLCLGHWITGCNNNTNKNQEAAALNRPPYAPLTDSLSNASTADKPGLYFRRAELLSRNNLHELATKDYQNSWELKPDELTGYRYASTLSILGQSNQAVRLLQDCQKKFPDNPAFSSLLAELYQQTGQLSDALGQYEDMLHKDSGNFEAWYEKGLLLQKGKDTAGAIQALGKAYELQPIKTYGLELAHLYAEQRNPSSLTICDDILSKDSAHELLDPYFIKGIYYSNTTQYKKAIIQFDSCIRRDWKFTDAYLEKGIALYEQKAYDTALNTFLMTIKVSNTYPDGYYWSGRCYEATGHKDKAILYYRQALALDKEFTEAADRIKKLE
ncbi:MAG: tetratricopeptide repeat protein [Bacteroidetes bacterium]|nr:tetratricopeptide repeat protein [Bacteroidota bacterium]